MSPRSTSRPRGLASSPSGCGRPAERLRVEWGDLRETAQVRRIVHAAAPDAIVHLAAVIPPPAHFDAVLARSVNVDGLGNLLAAAVALPRAPQVVFASSYMSALTSMGPRFLTTIPPLGPPA